MAAQGQEGISTGSSVLWEKAGLRGSGTSLTGEKKVTKR